MTFFEYMMRFVKKDSPSGDLARDMNRDKDFPMSNDRDEIMNHLRSKGACYDCLNTFDRCYRLYELYERKHSEEAGHE